MENKVKEIILNKKYTELSADERTILSEWCQDEIGFDELKTLLHLVGDLAQKESSFNPDISLKRRLDLEFERQFGTNKRQEFWIAMKNWFFPVEKPLWYRPALQFAFVGALALIALPFFMQQDAPSKVKVAKMETKNVESKKTNTSDSNNFAEKESDLSVPVKSKFIEGHNSTINNEFEVFEDIPSVAESMPALDETVSSRASGVSHPDGVYEKQSTKFSQSISEQEGVLDLLYPTF